ncbi:MAG: EI24 domain-containing protein [Pseudomonadota bacterium]
MVKDLGRAIGQLGDPRIRRILLQAVGATLLLLLGLVATVAGASRFLVETGVAWLDPLLPWLTGAGALVVAILLAPLAAISVLGLFVDAVADAVEARHYPGWGKARPIGVVEGLGQALRLLALTAGLNLLALPFYLLLPAFNLILYLVLNGFLLGREYFWTVAQRRMDARAVRDLYRHRRGAITFAGMVLALWALVPLVNLTLPVVGTAFMVHRYAALRARA